MSLKNRLKQNRSKQEVEEIRKEVGKFKAEIKQELQTILKEALGEAGALTLKGDRGYTPEVGVDFFTIKEREEMIKKAKGKDGLPGQRGRNAPSIGIIQKMVDFSVSDAIKKIKLPKIPNFDVEDLAKKVAKELEGKLDYNLLKNKPFIPKEGTGRTLHRGGQGLATFTFDLSSQTDGSTRSFTVPSHSRALLLISSDFPTAYRLTTDFITAGVTLTIDNSVPAPSSGSTLLFIYAQ